MEENKQILIVGGVQYKMVPKESGATEVVKIPPPTPSD